MDDQYETTKVYPIFVCPVCGLVRKRKKSMNHHLSHTTQGKYYYDDQDQLQEQISIVAFLQTLDLVTDAS